MPVIRTSSFPYNAFQAFSLNVILLIIGNINMLIIGNIRFGLNYWEGNIDPWNSV